MQLEAEAEVCPSAATPAATRFLVHPDLVRGTLRESFLLLDTLEPGLARAIFAMFLVAEVHPFADGNDLDRAGDGGRADGADERPRDP